MGWRRRLAKRMRLWADRLDHDGAPKLLHWTFTFEDHEGIRFREDGKGCQLAFLGGEANYSRAHDESDTAARKRAQWDALPEEAKALLRKHGATGP